MADRSSAPAVGERTLRDKFRHIDTGIAITGRHSASPVNRLIGLEGRVR